LDGDFLISEWFSLLKTSFAFEQRELFSFVILGRRESDLDVALEDLSGESESTCCRVGGE